MVVDCDVPQIFPRVFKMNLYVRVRQHTPSAFRPFNQANTNWRVEQFLIAQVNQFLYRIQPIQIQMKYSVRPVVLIDDGKRRAAHRLLNRERGSKPMHEAGLPRCQISIQTHDAA